MAKMIQSTINVPMIVPITLLMENRLRLGYPQFGHSYALTEMGFSQSLQGFRGVE